MMLFILRLHLKKVSKIKKIAVTAFLLSTVSVVSIPKQEGWLPPTKRASAAKIN